MPDSSMKLSEMIISVADEIRKAEKASPTDKVLKLEDCEIELAVRFAKEGKAGLKVWFAEAGGGASSEDTSRIKLRFSAARETAFRAQDTKDPGPMPARQSGGKK